MSSSSTCLATAASPTYELTSPSELNVSDTTRSSFVTRNGTRLFLNGQPYVAVGPNVYWLGQDENVQPNPAYPSQSRVLEVMAIAATMGANTIRSTTLGVSAGNLRSVETSLGKFNQTALETIDFALSAARSYGLKLIIPLTDQYDYYHGGIPTFLRWRNLSATEFTPFYNLSSPVYSDFTQYVTNLLTHRSNLTNLTMAEDPTVLAFETGNELGGYGGKAFPPTVEWTTSIAKLLKTFAPNTLIIDGSYGVRKDSLEIDEIDIVSDHAYPPYSYNVRKAANFAHSGGKVFILGEFDWTNRWYHPLIYLAVLVPVIIAALIWLLPAKWWPWHASLGCFCCRGRRRQAKSSYLPVMPDDSMRLSTSSIPLVEAKQYPPSNATPTKGESSSNPPTWRAAAQPLDESGSILDRSFLIRRWHFSTFIFLLAAPLGAIIHAFMPTPLSTFLPDIESLASDQKLSGSLYWSLFGKDSSCCRYVDHNDGFTLHYPSEPGNVDGSGQSVVELTKHAYRIRDATTWWSGKGVSDLSLKDLPSVACSQNSSSTEVVIGKQDLRARDRIKDL